MECFQDMTYSRKLSYHSQKEELGRHEKGALQVAKWFEVPDRGEGFKAHRFDLYSAEQVLYPVAAESAELKAAWLAALTTTFGPAADLAAHPRHAEFSKTAV